ncbi:cytochrome c maturation protein CcmE [Coralloluteibacterium stylophorae]|uniref:Cytochrome c-type biogenesis protein CcmE n=1 Tax=Coralloluteibacterium stylophorae TaxID=1776034 RepID=A0A8J7VZ70_9GAMM|nr:cytochrome c maturation protein CcmE [Coralloluteibacterium stylophorae]MBS7457555.1 cytochrome c maturation protein CcmE [Coralloluteibacterium stylophorae]
MNPTRKRRLLFVAALVAAAGLAATFVVLALQRNLTYLYTPSEVLAGQTSEQAVFRLGGMVKEGSLAREPETLKVRFTVLDADGELPVDYEGILPDLFRENQAVIATGSMAGGRFVASEVLAKHDEAYMPKEVADKMGINHARSGVDAGRD